MGIGNIGSRVAELCRGLFRMRVLAYDPYLTAEEIVARGGEKTELDQLLRDSDYVSINCPRTAETSGMIGAREFALMKPEAYFITTARGGIHDEAALTEALAAGQIAGAGLDVWEKDRRTRPSVAAIRQRGGDPAHRRGDPQITAQHGRFAAEQMLDILDGKRPKRLINPDVWPVYRERFGRILGFMPEA